MQLNVDVIYTVVSFAFPVKSFLFNRNYDAIKKLINDMKMSLRQTHRQQAVQDAKIIRFIAIYYVAYFGYAYALMVYYKVVSLSGVTWNNIDLTDLFFYTCMVLSYISLDFFNVLMEFVFLEICIHICSHFKQLEEDIEELNVVNDDKRVKAKMKVFIEVHQQLLELTSSMMNQFHTIVCINFVINTLLLGQTLLLAYNSDFYMLFVGLSYMLIDLWIFCYGSTLIKTRVNIVEFILESLFSSH